MPSVQYLFYLKSTLIYLVKFNQTLKPILGVFQKMVIQTFIFYNDLFFVSNFFSIMHLQNVCGIESYAFFRLTLFNVLSDNFLFNLNFGLNFNYGWAFFNFSAKLLPK